MLIYYVKTFFENFDENYFSIPKMRAHLPKLARIYEPMNSTERKKFVKTEDFKSFFQNKGVCAGCGGACCKESVCEYTVNDFEDFSFTKLRDFVDKGKSMVLLREDLGIISIIARPKNSPVVGSEKVLSGDCVSNGPTGCDYSYDDRPTGGALVIPGMPYHSGCRDILDTEYHYKQWLIKTGQKPLSDLALHYIEADDEQTR